MVFVSGEQNALTGKIDFCWPDPLERRARFSEEDTVPATELSPGIAIWVEGMCWTLTTRFSSPERCVGEDDFSIGDILLNLERNTQTTTYKSVKQN